MFGRLLGTLLGNHPSPGTSMRLGNGWGISSLTHGRAPMPPHLAEGLSSVLGCVELIAGAISSLPATLTIDGPDGQLPAPPTATAWALLRRPNPHQGWPGFMSSMVASALLSGNGVAGLRYDARGSVVGMVPVPWPWLSPQVIEGADGPRLIYDVVPTTPVATLLGLPRRLMDTDALHLRARSDEGIIGRSVLSRAAGVVREGADLAEVAAASWQNGMRASGVITHPGKLGQAAFDRLRDSLNARYSGAANTGKTLLFEEGMTYQSNSQTNADAELLSTRQFSVAEVARLFNVPLGLLQPGTGAQPYETMLAAFAQLSLAPLVAVIEAEFDHAILPPGMHLQLDMAGLQRGNFSGQVAAFCAATQSGITTPNDARRGLGFPSHAAGDTLRPGNAPTWPADVKGVPHLGPSPGPTGTGLPSPGNNGNGGAG